MSAYTVFFVVAGIVLFFLLTEVIAAVLPVVIVITMVPPEQRDDLARVLAACDRSRRLRLWPALKLAVEERRARLDGDAALGDGADQHRAVGFEVGI